MDSKIKTLNEKLEQAKLGGGQARIEKQHQKKKLTARERVMYLLDEGSFEEIGALVTHRTKSFGMDKQVFYGDGVITGYGTVYGKLIVLLGLAIYGILEWNPDQLTKGIAPKPWHAAIIGAGTIFMAYEGFQLLSYDYDDLKNPNKTLPKATIWAVIAVIIIYVLVTFGTTMLVGAATLVQQKEVALSVAGKKAMGMIGLVIVTIAAAFSTGSAINATLFSTARLMESVAKKKDLPHLFVKENKESIPYYALLAIAAFAAVLAIIGSLGSLVDAASIIFLFTFGTVNFIAFQQEIKYKWVSLLGAICCGLAIVADIIEKITQIPYAIIGLLVISVSLFVFRPYLLKRIQQTEKPKE